MKKRWIAVRSKSARLGRAWTGRMERRNGARSVERSGTWLHMQLPQGGRDSSDRRLRE